MGRPRALGHCPGQRHLLALRQARSRHLRTRPPLQDPPPPSTRHRQPQGRARRAQDGSRGRLRLHRELRSRRRRRTARQPSRSDQTRRPTPRLARQHTRQAIADPRRAARMNLEPASRGRFGLTTLGPGSRRSSSSLSPPHRARRDRNPGQDLRTGLGAGPRASGAARGSDRRTEPPWEPSTSGLHFGHGDSGADSWADGPSGRCRRDPGRSGRWPAEVVARTARRGSDQAGDRPHPGEIAHLGARSAVLGARQGTEPPAAGGGDATGTGER